MERASPLPLPGIWFSPTDEEILGFYLRNAVNGIDLPIDIIGRLNIYDYEPWDLSGLAKIGDKEWHFLVPREPNKGNGGRTIRTTKWGYWRAIGTNQQIHCAANPGRMVGVKKTLVYYQGRFPHGINPGWLMNEYRLPEDINNPSTSSTTLIREDIVLCKIYQKPASKKELEQRDVVEQYANEHMVMPPDLEK